MPININGAVIEGATASTYLSIFSGISGINGQAGSNPALIANSSGVIRKPQQIGFYATQYNFRDGGATIPIAGGVDPNWQAVPDGYGSSYGESEPCYQPNYRLFGNNNYMSRGSNQSSSSNWRRIVFPNPLVNKGNCYNPLNGRFTAPVTGYYIFVAQVYSYKRDGAAATYGHGAFFINGTHGGNASDNFPARATSRHKTPMGPITGGYSVDYMVEDVFFLYQNDIVEYVMAVNQHVAFYLWHSHFAGVLIG